MLLVVLLRSYVPRDLRLFVLPALLLWRAVMPAPLNTRARWLAGLSAAVWVAAITLDHGVLAFGGVALALLSYWAGHDKPKAAPSEG